LRGTIKIGKAQPLRHTLARQPSEDRPQGPLMPMLAPPGRHRSASLSRRGVLALGGIAVAAAALRHDAHGQATGVRTLAEGLRIIRARPSDSEPDAWGYDGAVPGPLLRVRRGEEIAVRLVNELPEPTAVHWHGVRLANAMDGVPGLTQPPIAPGASFDYRFIAPDAGTFWYHPPLDSGTQLDRGLAGVLLVEEAVPVDVDRDLAILLSDRQLSQSVDIAVRSSERLRLRLVNATYARVLAVRIAGHAATVMAIDGEPAEPFAARNGRVALGPGNRVDLFVDVALAPTESAPIVVETNGRELTVARLICESAADARPRRRAPPGLLPPNPLPAQIDLRNALKHEVALSRTQGGYGPPLFSVRHGRPVMLGLANRADAAQAVHVHGHHFRLLDRLDDGWKPFWLDTLLLPAGETDHIAFVADNPGKWRVHAHQLGQNRGAWSAWFEVT